MNAPRPSEVTARVEVLIVGAGFSGIATAIELLRAGQDDFILLEKAERVGGTWHFNTYPGAACDIPAHLYSYSFAPNPRWSRRYAGQPEIAAYLERCASQHGVSPHVRFGVTVRKAVFDVNAGRWRVECEGGAVFDARTLVLGNGALHLPAVPTLEGQEHFAGLRFHSSQWPKDFDPRGRRIAVLGTGASSVQIVPELAKHARALYVHQRTPAWILPRGDRTIGTVEQWCRAHLPGLLRASRAAAYWWRELGGLGWVARPSWMHWLERRALRHLTRSVSDTSLRGALTPTYRLGCKRVLLSDDYYPALERPNVELVTTEIARLSEHAVHTVDGAAREIDTLVYATGFQATHYLSQIDIVGPSGRSLQSIWRRRPGAYLGVHVAGFPNLFLLTGPNTGLGHNSMIVMIEAQARHIARCVGWIERDELRTLGIQLPVQKAYNDWLRKRLAKTVWATGCRSWYLTSGGLNTTLWPKLSFSYVRALRAIDRGCFEETPVGTPTDAA